MAKKPKNTLGPSQAEREYAALPQPEQTLAPNEKGEKEVGKVTRDGGFEVFHKKPKSNERTLDEAFGRDIPVKEAKKVAKKVVAEQAKPQGTQSGHHVTNSKNFTKKSN